MSLSNYESISNGSGVANLINIELNEEFIEINNNEDKINEDKDSVESVTY